MAYVVLFGAFTFFMLIGMPIAFCLGIASVATVLTWDCRRLSSSSR
jgi:hypothetical protein